MNQFAVVARFLKTQSTLALATSVQDAPHVAPLFYLTGDGLELYWFSAPTSRHSRELRATRTAAVTVYRQTADWRKIRGVQMRGRVSAVSRAGRGPVEQRYVERFRLDDTFRVALANTRLYRFQPAWVRYIDNSRGFGYRFEFSVGPGGILAS